MLNMLNIKYFMMVEQERNFSKAARKLYISQQCLSNHIKSLEDELDTKLFERTSPLRLTETGSILLQYCQNFSTEYLQFLNRFNDAKQNRSGHLRLGISFTRGRIILPQLLPYFKALYPTIDVTVLEENRHELATALLDKKIDLMIGEFNKFENDISFENLMNDEIVMLVPKKFISDNENISIDSVKDFPFLLNKDGNTPRIIADEIFHENHIIPNVIFEAENTETLFELCVAEMGIIFYPRSFLNGHKSVIAKNKVNIVELPYEFVHYPIKIAYLKYGYLSKSAADFISLAKKTYNK